MALVAYGSSDESEEEVSNKKEDVKKQKESVKILIPSLKEFEEEIEVPPKRTKFQQQLGLFNLLPPPQNTYVFSKPGFTPNVLSSKKEQVSLTCQKYHEVSMCETEIHCVSSVTNSCQNDEKSDSEDKICNHDYFSLDRDISNDTHASPNYLLTESCLNLSEVENKSSEILLPDNTSIHSTESRVSSKSQQLTSEPYEEDCYSTHLPNPSSFVAVSSVEESILKDKEFLKLQGRHHEFENVNIIDVNADDQLTNRNEWLIKSLTEESTHRPSRKKQNMPTQVQKRKHQITYLAFQAKEREMDLKNQWAINSRTRRETQAKYGF